MRHTILYSTNSIEQQLCLLQFFDIIINALKNSYISIFMYLSKDFIDVYSQKENLLGFFLLKRTIGTCLVVQWLRVHAPNARRMTAVPGWGTKILHAKWYGLEKKKGEG